MERKTITLILSFAIFCSFFMPLFDWHSFELNGLNYILSTHINPYKYFLIGIPVSAAVLFFSVVNGEEYFLNKRFFYWLPLVTIVFIFLMESVYASSEAQPASYNILSNIDFGFWLTLCFSGLLALVKKKKQGFSEN